MAPKFKGKLTSENEFLTAEGGYEYKYYSNTDGTPDKSVNPLRKYFTNSTTTLPAEILNTGNIDVINNYISETKLDPDSKEYKHLQERISAMTYFNELESRSNEKKPVHVGPMKKNKQGLNVLPGIVLDSRQTSAYGCWSCAFSLLLKSCGVDVSQELIRRYRPEFMEGLGPVEPKTTDIINGNAYSEIFQFSELVGKLSPNTLVKKMYVGKDGAGQADANNYILDCLRSKNAPVAVCKDKHWITVVGVSDDGQTVNISDSLEPGGTITTMKLDDLTAGNLEMVWTESMALHHQTKQPFAGNKNVTVDKDTGAVLLKEGALSIAPITRTKGLFVKDDRNENIEVYVPPMIRDFGKKYKKQKAEYDAFKERNQSPAEITDEVTREQFLVDKNYHFLSEATRDKARAAVDEQALIALDAARRNSLKESKKYADDVIDKMTREELEKEFTQPVIADEKQPEPAKEPEPEKQPPADVRTDKQMFDDVSRTFAEYREYYNDLVNEENRKVEAARKRIREREAAKKKAEAPKKPEEKTEEEVLNKTEEKVEEKKEEEILNKAEEKNEEINEKETVPSVLETFDRRLEAVKNDDKLSPRLKELETNLLQTQQELSDAFSEAGGIIDKNCVEAGAKLVTLVTLSKVCKQLEEADPSMIDDLLKPEKVSQCVKEVRNGGTYAERVTRALCGFEKDHVLSLENKDIFKIMVDEIKEEKKLDKSGKLSKTEEKKKTSEKSGKGQVKEKDKNVLTMR